MRLRRVPERRPGRRLLLLLLLLQTFLVRLLRPLFRLLFRISALRRLTFQLAVSDQVRLRHWKHL